MRIFIGFGQQQYIGTPQTRAMKLGNIASVGVPLLFQWISYGASTAVPNVNVLVDMETANCKALDQIRSIYIDNLGSANPIYVYFPDTQYVVVAKPNSEGWYPAYTNQKKIWVIGEGFLTGTIPQTLIIASNVALEANVNVEIDNAVALWRASPIISRGTSIYNSDLGTPALGDQLQASPLLPANVPGATVPLWGTPYASGFLYLTSLVINGMGLSNAAPVSGICVIESTGVAGVLVQPAYYLTNVSVLGVSNILTLTGLQIKLDATQSWRARIITAGDGGTLQFYASFTQTP